MSGLIDEKDAVGKTAEIYKDIEKHFGMVPNFFKAQAAVDADWLELNWKRLKQIMLADGGLDRKARELIAYAVSAVNDCGYCKTAHENMARMNGATDREFRQTQQIVELFCSFNAIADTLDVPLDAAGE